jgi:hypothetical protein
MSDNPERSRQEKSRLDQITLDLIAFLQEHTQKEEWEIWELNQVFNFYPDNPTMSLVLRRLVYREVVEINADQKVKYVGDRRRRQIS